MIGRLTGLIEVQGPGQLLVDVGGVGYDVAAPASTVRTLKQGENATLLIHTSFTQDQLTLHGFGTNEELRIFRMLLKVDRVGPRLALAILGTLGPDGLARAVLADDLKALNSVSGVGKKTAQRLLLELRSHMEDVKPLAALSLPTSKAAGPASAQSDAIEALMALGYSRGQAQQSVDIAWRAQGKKGSVQSLITSALLHLSKPVS